MNKNKDYKELVKILDFEFNHKLDFAGQKPKEVIDYVNSFLKGETEYCIEDNGFPKDKVLFLIKKLEIISLIDDLHFDYDRMSSSGKKTLDEIAKLFENFDYEGKWELVTEDGGTILAKESEVLND
tara:strand:- start:161 stop:538 length:378 start_codon:yes stop_codon:yes gene_type:complete